MKFLFKTAAVTAIFAMAAPAMALTASQTIQKEVVTTAADGTETVTYDSAELVTPGERLLYKLDYANDKAEAASNLVLTMPVPDVVSYAEGTAKGEGTVMTYSVDGSNFYARKNLIVRLGNGESREASAEDITHVRWLITGPVEPGEMGTLAFTGTLK